MKKWNTDEIDMRKIPKGALVVYSGSLPYHGIAILKSHEDYGMVTIETHHVKNNGDTVLVTCRLESIALMGSIAYPETLCGGRSALHWAEGISNRWCLPWNNWTELNYWEMV